MKLATLLVLICLAAGCLSAPKAPLQKDNKYPADWPEISSHGLECEAIDGTYANAGVAANRAEPVISLVGLFPFESNTRPTGVKSVGLKVVKLNKDEHGNESTRLQVTLQADAKFHYELDCVCVNGNIILNGGGAGVLLPIFVITVWESSRVTFSKAVDGSLIAKYENVGGGPILGIPTDMPVTYWARFERVRD
jgi:hypothetical protein